MDDEDDFGEVYADVGAIREDKIGLRSGEDDELNGNGSDSEDDLRIVLNDDDEDNNNVVVVEDNHHRRSINNNTDDLSDHDHRHYTYVRPQLSASSFANAASLPRHRTILDVNIDAFAHKPWKQPGVDLTNFFNFGFHEDAWKHYCNSLELFRLKTAMPSTFQPKGRAIQVDGGNGDRLPSMDTRRPQNRDSNVVIQISVLDNIKCSSFSTNDQHSLSDNSNQNISESASSDMAVTQDELSAQNADESKRHIEQTNASTALLGHHDCQHYKDILEVVACQPHKEYEHICTENIEDAKVKMQRNSSIQEPCTMEAESTLSDRCKQSKRHENNYWKTEQRDYECYSRNLSHRRGKQGTHSTVRLHTLTEKPNCVGGSETLPMLTRYVCDADSHLAKRYHRCRERHEMDYQGGEGLPYYRETEISFGYHRERFVEKPVRTAYTESFNENRPMKLRNKIDPCLSGHWDEQEYILKSTITFRENEARESENYIRETQQNPPLYIEKGRCRWQRRKRNFEEYFWRGSDDDDCVLGHGYTQGNCGRPVSYYGREREYLNENHIKNISDGSPDRRDRNSWIPYRDVLTDSSMGGAHNDKYWKHPHHEPSSPHRELHTHGRKWRDATSPVHKYDDDLGPCRQAVYEKNQSNDLFNSPCKYTRNAVTVAFSDSDLSNKKRRHIQQSRALDCPERINLRQQNQGKIYAKQSSQRGGIPIEKYGLTHCQMLLEENSLVHVGNRKIREDTRYSGVNTHIVSSFDIVDENEDKKASPRQRKSIDLQVVGWNGKGCGKGGIDVEDKRAKVNGRLKSKREEESENKVEERRILETLAKMEKRRERFQEPITPKEAADTKQQQPPPDSSVVQQRPARKRRWGHPNNLMQ